MVHDDEVSNLKESIKNFNNLYSIEKKNLIETIEILLLNSIVKKCSFLLYASASGVPKAAEFSMRVNQKQGAFFLKYW